MDLRQIGIGVTSPAQDPNPTPPRSSLGCCRQSCTIFLDNHRLPMPMDREEAVGRFSHTRKFCREEPRFTDQPSAVDRTLASPSPPPQAQQYVRITCDDQIILACTLKGTAHSRASHPLGHRSTPATRDDAPSLLYHHHFHRHHHHHRHTVRLTRLTFLHLGCSATCLVGVVTTLIIRNNKIEQVHNHQT